MHLLSVAAAAETQPHVRSFLQVRITLGNTARTVQLLAVDSVQGGKGAW